jgi:hypothetical protein
MRYTDPHRNGHNPVLARQPPRIDRYSDVAIALHWLIAVAIFAMLALGLYMVGLPKGLPFKADLINVHKSLGLTILLLVLARIAVRAVSRPPPDMPMPAWQRIVVCDDDRDAGVRLLGLVVQYLRHPTLGHRIAAVGLGR